MQEWIIAMLVVSILLILRDMAKTVFSGRTQAKEEMMPLSESIPRRRRWNDMQHPSGNLRIHSMECLTERNF